MINQQNDRHKIMAPKLKVLSRRANRAFPWGSGNLPAGGTPGFSLRIAARFFHSEPSAPRPNGRALSRPFGIWFKEHKNANDFGLLFAPSDS